MQRRDFIKAGTAAGAIAGFEYAMPMRADAYATSEGINIGEGLYYLEQGKAKNTMPAIRREILDNPKAVFIIDTNVAASRDNRGFYTSARAQLETEGKRVAKLLLEKGSKRGGSTMLRPNFTDVPDSVLSPVCGINTSCDFVAGFNDGLRELGNTNTIVGTRGAGAVTHRKNGIYDVLDAHGMKMMEARYKKFQHYNKKELNWHRVEGKPMVWKRIPTYRPIGDEDNFFINMPKLKCHNLGLTTLSIKNIQGAVPTGYGHYCNAWAALEFYCKHTYMIDFKKNFVKDYYQNVEAAFLKHRAAGFKHWDVEGSYDVYQKNGGWEKFKQIKNDIDKVREFMSDVKSDDSKGATRGSIPRLLMWDEQWCQRALDSASAIKPDLNVVEGVIGRDGSGFDTGQDELANVVLAGLSMVEVDTIGTHLMGHDPKELYYTRIAKERGIGECDPEKIAVYHISENGITRVKNINALKRVKLGVNLHTWSETNKRLFW